MDASPNIDIAAKMYRQSDQKDLWQGDIIHRRELIDTGALSGHQDYIAQRDDFPGFCVVTQTCDLVREEESGSEVDFICLSVIRRLTDVFSKNTSQKEIRKTKDKLKNILNHDYTKQGYFFLPSEPSILMEDCVVDLRTTFSLYAEKHYDQVLKARKLSLTDVYANRLGWMLGNIFSRVPTPDWDEETRQQRIDHLVDAIQERGGPKKLSSEEPIYGLDAIARDPNKIKRLNDVDSQRLLGEAKRVLEALERTSRT